MILNQIAITIANLSIPIDEKFHQANKIIEKNTIKLLPQSENSNVIMYLIEEIKETVSITFDGNNITHLECSCCREKNNGDINKIKCEKSIAVLLHHSFIKIDKENFSNNKLSKSQLIKINNAINSKSKIDKNDFDIFLTQIIEYQLEEELLNIAKKDIVNFETYFKSYINVINQSSMFFVIYSFLNNQIKLPIPILIKYMLLNSKTLTENEIMNYYDEINDIDRIKRNNPDLFNVTKQSIAFKMFLMMKGV